MVLNEIKRWIRAWKVKKLFKNNLHDVWFAGRWHGNRAENLPPYFLNGKYVNYDEGDIVPMERKNGITAFYEIVSFSRPVFYDAASWDDGRKYNLRLHHVEESTDGNR